MIVCNSVPGTIISIWYCIKTAELASAAESKMIVNCVIASLIFQAIIGGLLIFIPNHAEALKLFIQITTLICNFMLYASPLSTVRSVIITRDASSIDILLTLAILACSFLWLVYGFAVGAVNIWISNAFGVLCSCVQLALIVIFPRVSKGKGAKEMESEVIMQENVTIADSNDLNGVKLTTTV